MALPGPDAVPAAVDVPRGYAATRLPGVLVVAREDLIEQVSAIVRGAGSLHGFAASGTHVATLHGRGPVHLADIAGTTCVVRHYRRGGTIARFLGDRYLAAGLPRPLRELRASVAVRARTVPSPEVIAATVHDAGVFRRGDIAVAWVPDSADLAAISFGAQRRPEDERVRAWAAAGALIRRAAATGVVHADLNLKNILLGHTHAAAPTAWLIDLDRCTVREAPAEGDLERMVARVQHSRERFEARTGERLRPELHAFRSALHA